VDFILFFTLFLLLLIMSLSIVQGAPPIIVRNDAIMDAPYETGDADSGESDGRKDARADSEYDATQGLAYASVFASKTSNAWAYSYLQDAFEIIHSSNYKLTFSFDYKGLIEITGVNLYSDANARVDLTVYLIERDGGEIMSQKTETIANYAQNFTEVLTGQMDLTLAIFLEENNIYDWRAELRTEASAHNGASDTAQATVNFYSKTDGYQAKIVQVLVEDLNPDYIPPTTTYSLSGIEGENDWYTSDVSVELSAEDDSYGVEYTNWRINDDPWSLYASSFSISFEGTNTLEFYSVDKAGNYENIKSVSIKIDRNRPTGQVSINNNAQYTSSVEVTLTTLTQDEQGSGVAQMRFRNEGKTYEEVWLPYATSSPWTLQKGDGTKRVYAQFKDNAGNISPETYDEIILDTEPPLASILINEGDEYTNSTSVTLYLQYSDNQGIDLVRYSNDGILYTNWTLPSETEPWTLLPEDGTKTVYAQFRDRAGLNSNFVFDTIILDTIPPAGSIEINDGAATTTSTSVTITPSATDANGVAHMRLRNDGENWSAWEEVATKTWNLTSQLGVKTVFAQFKDNAGLVSPFFNATINLVEPEPTPSPAPSPTPPPSTIPSEKGNLIVYVKDENMNPISGATVTSTVQPSIQSPLIGVTNLLGSLTFNDIIAGSYSLHISKSGFGNNDAQITVKSQQTSSITITLREDLNEPTVSVKLNPEDSGIPQRTFTVTAEDDMQGSGIAKITLYVDEVPVAIWTKAGTYNYDAGVYSIGTHTYYVEAEDNAGNRARNPASGDFKFTVVEGAYIKQTELWKLMGLVLVLASGTALLFFSLKSKKGKQ
jgi:hypothetical protein